MRQSNSSYIDVTIPAGRPLRKLKGIRCHRAEPRAAGRIRRRRHPVHLRLENASRSRNPASATKGLVSAANEAVVQQVFDMREMDDLLNAARRAIAVSASCVRSLNRGIFLETTSRSRVSSRRFARLCAQHGLPKPAINRWVLLGDEYKEVDFLWRAEEGGYRGGFKALPLDRLEAGPRRGARCIALRERLPPRPSARRPSQASPAGGRPQGSDPPRAPHSVVECRVTGHLGAVKPTLGEGCGYFGSVGSMIR